MYTMTVRYLVLTLLLDVFLASVLVNGSLFFSLFFPDVENGGKEFGRLTGECALQAVASGVNNENVADQILTNLTLRYKGEEDLDSPGMSAAQLDYSQLVAREVRRYSSLYVNHYNGTEGSRQWTFVSCCLGNSSVVPADTRVIGRDCMLQIMALNIADYYAGYQQEFCYDGSQTSPDCEFINCAYNGYKRDYRYAKEFAINCYQKITSPSSSPLRNAAEAAMALPSITEVFLIGIGLLLSLFL